MRHLLDGTTTRGRPAVWRATKKFLTFLMLVAGVDPLVSLHRASMALATASMYLAMRVELSQEAGATHESSPSVPASPHRNKPQLPLPNLEMTKATGLGGRKGN